MKKKWRTESCIYINSECTYVFIATQTNRIAKKCLFFFGYHINLNKYHEKKCNGKRSSEFPGASRKIASICAIVSYTVILENDHKIFVL